MSVTIFCCYAHEDEPLLKKLKTNLPSVAVLPLILSSQHEYGMFEHFTRFHWVLPVYRYKDEVNLIQTLQEKVITPTEQKVEKLALEKAKQE